MRYLTLREILYIHERVMAMSGGATDMRDASLLESAIARPQAHFGGTDFYPTIVEKAAALCISIVMNHPFLDGNKRVGHAAMEVFLQLNGMQLIAPVEEQESLMLRLAAGGVDRETFVDWLQKHVRDKADTDE